MKNIITSFLIILLFSCVNKFKPIKQNGLEITLENISQRFDVDNINYIGVKNYCIGTKKLDPVSVINCASCYSKNEIYFFWDKNSKSFLQKFDNCSEYKIIEITNFNVTKYLKFNSAVMQKEKIKYYKLQNGDTFINVHSCFSNYIINDGVSKYTNNFDKNNLTGGQENLNFIFNNNLKLVQLDKKLNTIIKILEKEKKFKRDLSSCKKTN